MALSLALTACTAAAPIAEGDSDTQRIEAHSVRGEVDFEHELDPYKPEKDQYNFYFTYKTVHPWWDAVALGMEDAQRQFLDRGIRITYEYMAPDEASADDQKKRLAEAEKKDYDVIGVDVADLTEALCKKLDYKGKVAILVGSVGAPCHEDRARGAADTIAKYSDMEIVATEYDMDSVDKAYDLKLKILKDNPDLNGIVCCNMSNPVGADRAITEKGSGAVIVGMDHDEEALHYLKDGVIYCLGVQDCYSIGFDTIQIAVMIADGNLPGELFPEKTDEITTVIYQEDAAQMLELLYGDVL
ncbi:MAG: substrate-binding domain-containing protein [Lachnospiraceae bacterium]|nr:substrate-binding domain-containing protein [Lachnospiraceae bacterium]